MDVPSDAIETFFYLSLAAFLLPEHSGAADLQNDSVLLCCHFRRNEASRKKNKQTLFMLSYDRSYVHIFSTSDEGKRDRKMDGIYGAFGFFVRMTGLVGQMTMMFLSSL